MLRTLPEGTLPTTVLVDVGLDLTFKESAVTVPIQIGLLDPLRKVKSASQV
jgi:hypothetical protein